MGITFPGFKLLSPNTHGDPRVRVVSAYTQYPSNYRLSEFPSWATLPYFACTPLRNPPREKSIFRARVDNIPRPFSCRPSPYKRLPCRRATSPPGVEVGTCNTLKPPSPPPRVSRCKAPTLTANHRDRIVSETRDQESAPKYLSKEGEKM